MNVPRLFPLLLLTLVSTASAQQPAPSGTAASAPAPKPVAAAPAVPVVPTDPAVEQLRQAYVLIKNNDFDGSLPKLNEAIRLNPKLLPAYITRGGLYYAKKQWDLSEKDFAAASQLDPANVVVKFQLGEIKFQQKQYDAARPRFAALQSDADMSDFASYKVFLCDLYGGHKEASAKELAAFNDTGSRPSYYFGNAAWELFNKNIDKARDWLTSASRIYSPGKNQFYAQSLRDLGYLPLPVKDGQ